MKSFEKLIAIVFVILLCIIIAVNLVLAKVTAGHDNLYKVEISRVEHEIENGNMIAPEQYDTISDVYEYHSEPDFYNSPNAYVIREINGKLYRIEYHNNTNQNDRKIRIIVNVALGLFILMILAVLLYIKRCIVEPFHKISDLPYELAKGNLTVPLKENKSRYFGKFIWGLDMLREELEHTKQQRLDKIKEEKTLLLSLSHDIKTPLSAIKLYSKALSKGLYTDRQKQITIAENIDTKADEIERIINEIIRNANSDFLTFEINLSEFYLSQVIHKISDSYQEKLSETGTLFEVDTYSDCLLSGDADRLEEVLQNIIENAIKYGDGHSISIHFSDEEECRLITVANSGCTLSDTELPHIFDSFWRGSNTGNAQGSGLGLYICRRLMTDMGGDIFAEISNGYMNVTLVCKKIY